MKLTDSKFSGSTSKQFVFINADSVREENSGLPEYKIEACSMLIAICPNYKLDFTSSPPKLQSLPSSISGENLASFSQLKKTDATFLSGIFEIYAYCAFMEGIKENKREEPIELKSFAAVLEKAKETALKIENQFFQAEEKNIALISCRNDAQTGYSTTALRSSEIRQSPAFTEKQTLVHDFYHKRKTPELEKKFTPDALLQKRKQFIKTMNACLGATLQRKFKEFYNVQKGISPRFQCIVKKSDTEAYSWGEYLNKLMLTYLLDEMVFIILCGKNIHYLVHYVESTGKSSDLDNMDQLLKLTTEIFLDQPLVWLRTKFDKAPPEDNSLSGGGSKTKSSSNESLDPLNNDDSNRSLDSLSDSGSEDELKEKNISATKYNLLYQTIISNRNQAARIRSVQLIDFEIPGRHQVTLTVTTLKSLHELATSELSRQERYAHLRALADALPPRQDVDSTVRIPTRSIPVPKPNSKPAQDSKLAQNRANIYNSRKLERNSPPSPQYTWRAKK